MRVVAGSARGRRLEAPAGRQTRPTSDRVREALFNVLVSMGVLEGAAVADLFAGSGALGIEALSRGAASAVLIDRAPPAVAAVRANLAVLGSDARRATVVRDDALRWLASFAGPLDLVFADPPYSWEGWPELLPLLHRRRALLVAETGTDWRPGEGWETVKQRRYGGTVVTVARPEGES